MLYCKWYSISLRRIFVQERQTKQKQIIYEALTALNHPTATEVYGYVRERQSTVSRATVFRVLGSFSTGGRVRELRLAGSEVRYDYNVEPHYHARCVACGGVTDVWKGDKQERLEVAFADDFEIEGYSVEFFGRCRECAKKGKKADENR